MWVLGRYMSVVVPASLPQGTPSEMYTGVLLIMKTVFVQVLLMSPQTIAQCEDFAAFVAMMLYIEMDGFDMSQQVRTPIEHPATITAVSL